MAEEETPDTEEGDAPKKGGGMTKVLVGIIFALILGGGGFFATYTGMVGGSDPLAEEEMAEKEPEDPPKDLPPITFVALDPIVISVRSGGESRHLRFQAQLEVKTGYEAEVETLKPRILDVLNSYLRAVDSAQFEEPGALIGLRSQMLRRIQIVTGEGRVRDLLIAEFVLS